MTDDEIALRAPGDDQRAARHHREREWWPARACADHGRALGGEVGFLPSVGLKRSETIHPPPARNRTTLSFFVGGSSTMLRMCAS
jgi:hypothetical protein